MTEKELKRLVSRGEGLRLEFKRRVPEGERIAKEIIALANTEGGQLLLGVSDSGTVSGLRDSIEQEFMLRRALETYCKPVVDFTTERIPVAEEGDVILVTVPESKTKPHFLIEKSVLKRTAYVRSGEMSVEASPEAVRLMEEEHQPRAATFEFGENELMLMRYLEDYAHVTVSQFARMAGISRDRASRTLMQLARANILQLQADRGEDYFTLSMNE